MVLLTFSFTGENTTGAATFTIAQEYKFKNLYLKDIKYNIVNEKLEEIIGKATTNAGLGSIDTTITSPLALHMDFLDTKDVVTYSLDDGEYGGGSAGTPIQTTGLIPFGYAGKTLTNISDTSTISHSYPYHLIINRPQTWAVGKTLVFNLYYRDVQTDGLIKDWTVMSGETDAFSDICSIDITLQLE
tara:strand:+ start:1394 stop:1954 length:561 start_codon:yes stop_codon:yes gene_type:complete